jgi:hypothetical protein
LVEAACFDEAMCFDETTCAGGLPCFGEPLKMSDSQPASLASIGRSTNAAVTAMTVQRRGTPRPEAANLPPDDGIPGFPQNDLPFALHGRTRLHNRHFEPSY